MVKDKEANKLRNFIFGGEDSLVSTLGLLFGIASVSSFSRTEIFITGLIAITVEAFSMGAGSFLSEDTAQAIAENPNKTESPKIDGVIMFFSYITFGLIPLWPFLVFDITLAKYISGGTTLIALYILGYLPAKNPKQGMKMVVVAGLAALMGFVVAYFFSL